MPGWTGLACAFPEGRAEGGPRAPTDCPGPIHWHGCWARVESISSSGVDFALGLFPPPPPLLDLQFQRATLFFFLFFFFLSLFFRLFFSLASDAFIGRYLHRSSSPDRVAACEHSLHAVRLSQSVSRPVSK